MSPRYYYSLCQTGAEKAMRDAREATREAATTVAQANVDKEKMAEQLKHAKFLTLENISKVRTNGHSLPPCLKALTFD